MPGRKPRPVADRIRDRVTVDPATGCWVFDGLDSHGYGHIWVGSRTDGTRRLRKAHVVAYETFVGPVADGLDLDHLCRNRACCNPAHLEPVTHRENLRRSPITQAAKQAARTHCPKEHEYTDQNTIRDRYGKRYCRECKRTREREGRMQST